MPLVNNLSKNGDAAARTTRWHGNRIPCTIRTTSHKEAAPDVRRKLLRFRCMEARN